MANEVGFLVGGSISTIVASLAVSNPVSATITAIGLDRAMTHVHEHNQGRHMQFVEEYYKKMLAMKLSENYTVNLANVKQAYLSDLDKGNTILDQLLHGAMNSQKLNNFK